MGSKLKVKVCGMKYRDNIHQLVELEPDFMGLIFYPKSKRFVDDTQNESIIQAIPDTIQKVGVFVNSTPEEIIEKADRYKLNYVQLHGDENPDFCIKLKNQHIKNIKVFRITDNISEDKLEAFSACSDFFLFDTQTSNYGGSGRKFNWEMLDSIPIDKPFFLSGGIGPNDAEKISKLNLTNMYAVDINSQFELEPGRKDIEKVKLFMEKIRGIA
jgi:phosphoribosylanthranilate isomerase